jgi:hypothetical protein
VTEKRNPFVAVEGAANLVREPLAIELPDTNTSTTDLDPVLRSQCEVLALRPEREAEAAHDLASFLLLIPRKRRAEIARQLTRLTGVAVSLAATEDCLLPATNADRTSQGRVGRDAEAPGVEDCEVLGSDRVKKIPGTFEYYRPEQFCGPGEVASVVRLEPGLGIRELRQDQQTQNCQRRGAVQGGDKACETRADRTAYKDGLLRDQRRVMTRISD